MKEDMPKASEYEAVQAEEDDVKLVKRRFLRKAKALLPVPMDPLNVQTGIAASIIEDILEGSRR